jgi:hypothetical protein
MGWSYSHVALFGPAQKDVSQTLAGRHAVISPTIGGVTLVASEEFASHDPQQIANFSFSIKLATALNCAALVISEYDDDVLSYQLIESGKITDEYNSVPDYFDFAGKYVPPGRSSVFRMFSFLSLHAGISPASFKLAITACVVVT